MSHGQGGVARTRRRWLGRSRDWVSYVELRVAEEVSVLRVNTRLVPVAGHGSAVVVWTRKPPTIVALDASGAALGTFPAGRVVSRRAGPVD